MLKFVFNKHYGSYQVKRTQLNLYSGLNLCYCFTSELMPSQIMLSTENLKQLIASSKECGITFYYALSPGLDILFSNSRDVQLLKKKMDQVVIVVFLFTLLQT